LDTEEDSLERKETMGDKIEMVSLSDDVVRLECMKLAMGINESISTDGTIADANKIYQFVKFGSVPGESKDTAG
jgi:hypothetical protein